MRHRLFLFVSTTLVCATLGQDVVYPKHEEPAYLSGNNPVITERIPVYIPDRCPENMLLYPGGGDKSSWACDCKPGFLYFPLNSTCYAAFSQGPCAPGSYVYLAQGEAVPVCVENTCSPSDRVPFNGNCYTIGSTNEAPCGRGSTLRVNETTFQLECAEVVHQIGAAIVAAPQFTRNPCPPGSDRVRGVCRKPL